MYPEWVKKLSRLICEDCRGIASVHDVIAVGVARPNPQEAYAGPLAMLIVACPVCGERMSITVHEPMESILLALQEFVRLSDVTARAA